MSSSHTVKLGVLPIRQADCIFGIKSRKKKLSGKLVRLITVPLVLLDHFSQFVKKLVSGTMLQPSCVSDWENILYILRRVTQGERKIDMAPSVAEELENLRRSIFCIFHPPYIL